jgi:hypothetical protein
MSEPELDACMVLYGDENDGPALGYECSPWLPCFWHQLGLWFGGAPA